MNKECIIDVLRYYSSVVKEKRVNTIFGVFLKGSQNYNLDTRISDIDAVALLIPTKNMLITDRKLDTHSITTQYGIISVVDIRNFAKGLLNGNPQELEILNTEFYIIENNNNKKEWEQLKNKSLYFEYINPQGTLLALQGQMKSYYKNFQKSDTIDSKNLMHLARLNHLIFSWHEDIYTKRRSYFYKMKSPIKLSKLRNIVKTPEIESYAEFLFEEAMNVSCQDVEDYMFYYYAEEDIHNFILELLQEELEIKIKH